MAEKGVCKYKFVFLSDITKLYFWLFVFSGNSAKLYFQVINNKRKSSKKARPGNQTENFVDPETGRHTQLLNVCGTWLNAQLTKEQSINQKVF